MSENFFLSRNGDGPGTVTFQKSEPEPELEPSHFKKS